MTPRQPPESPDDEKQSELLRAVHRALNDITPVPDPADKKPATEMRQVEPADETEVEIDRIESYLRGPTAFTA